MIARRILIIDDDELLGAVARLGLERQPGWLATHASSARAGIEAAIAQAPDAILLDVEMPGMNGLDAARELRRLEATQGVPLVMLSATDARDMRLLCDQLDVAGSIAKPFDPMGLAASVAALLGWAEALTTQGM